MGHHSVPVHYLRGFAVEDDRDKIWMFDKSTRDFKLLPIKNVAQSRGFYFDEDERALNEQVELPAIQPLNKLTNGNYVNENERRKIAVYLHILLLRVPKARDDMRQMLKRELPSMVTSVENELIELPHMPQSYYDQVKALADRWRPDNIDDLPSEELRELLGRQWVHPNIVERLYTMTWRVLNAENNNTFITSDNPFFFFKGLGLDNRDVEVSVPLSSRTALHMSYQGKPETTLFIPAETRLVNEINRRTAGVSDRFLFHQRQEKWIEKLTRVTRPRVNRMRW